MAGAQAFVPDECLACFGESRTISWAPVHHPKLHVPSPPGQPIPQPSLKTLLLLASLATGLISAVTLYPAPDNPEKEKAIVSTAINALSGLHFEPPTLDDAFSEKVYRLYLDRIDGARRFFTQEDLDLFEAHRNTIDDELQGADLGFFDLTEQRLALAMARSQKIYREVLAQPFDFTTDERLELDGEKKPFPVDEAGLREAWRKALKWETMTRLNDLLEQQRKAVEGEDDVTSDPPLSAADEQAIEEVEAFEEEPDDLIGKTQAELEADARKAVLKSFDEWYERMGKLKRIDRLSDYLNTVTSIYDPHTGYFAPVEKENFDIAMAGKLEGIGARLQTDGEFTKVTDIVVGGPAWKGKELQEKDVITKVKQENADAISIAGMNINEVVSMIRGPKGTLVELTVRRVDGSIQEIVIERDVVVLEEGFAKSLILHTEEGNKVGYIRLPRFYADFEDDEGRSSARDVRTEIEKLKAENVSGMILDLRNNGGGSLRDVVDMTGFFIDEGAVVQVKSRGRAPEVLEDNDKKVQYDGPLVVMVNEFSASASEILAAALQDYGRAVIVGNTTFGKGTVQRFIDLDVALRGASTVKPLGNLKVTTQKFYRVNGGSTQLEGVTPDIKLPDSYAYIETGERENDYPMLWDKIAPARYKRTPEYTAKLGEVRDRSEARTKLDPAFQAIDAYAKELRAERDETEVSLKLEDFASAQKQRNAESKKFKELFTTVEDLSADNLRLDKLQMESADEGKMKRNQDFIDRARKDVHLYETVLILNDLIKTDVRVAERR